MDKDKIYGINPLLPSGTNSTFFTECCGCAICNNERFCPVCGSKVVGYDAKSESDRRRIRWLDATRNW